MAEERKTELPAIHWFNWRQIIPREVLPHLVSHDDGVFDPALSFVVSHLSNPVSVNYKLNRVFGEKIVKALKGFAPEMQPLFPHKSPPDWKGKDVSGEFYILDERPALFSYFYGGWEALLHIYCEEKDVEWWHNMFWHSLREEVRYQVCIVKGSEMDFTWVWGLSPIGYPEILPNYPPEVRENIRVIENICSKALAGETKRGAAFLLLGAPGVGKTLLAKALFDHLIASKDNPTMGFYIHMQQQDAPFLRIYNSIQENRDFFKDFSIFYILDDAEWLLLSRKKVSLASPVFKILDILDNIPPRQVVCLITNMVSELDTAAIRPGRIDFILNIPPSGWGLSVFNFWAEKLQLPSTLREDIVKDETLRAAVNKMTPAEVHGLVEYLCHRSELGFACGKKEVKDAIKAYTKWRRVYKERDWEEVESDVF